uniref:GST C-terminal domain-containing protein n=1 Tax=Strigamia maritima TaxID=126957 RepID=T1J8U7_STRMM
MASTASKGDDPDEKKNRFQWFCEQMRKRTDNLDDNRLKLATPETSAIGGSSTVHYIARMCGVSIEERAVLQQWMEYVSNHIDRSSCKAETVKILRNIDSHLASRSFLNGNSISLADLYVYASLNSILVPTTNVSRERKHRTRIQMVPQHPELSGKPDLGAPHNIQSQSFVQIIKNEKTKKRKNDKKMRFCLFRIFIRMYTRRITSLSVKDSFGDVGGTCCAHQRVLRMRICSGVSGGGRTPIRDAMFSTYHAEPMPATSEIRLPSPAARMGFI